MVALLQARWRGWPFGATGYAARCACTVVRGVFRISNLDLSRPSSPPKPLPRQLTMSATVPKFVLSARTSSVFWFHFRPMLPHVGLFFGIVFSIVFCVRLFYDFGAILASKGLPKPSQNPFKIHPGAFQNPSQHPSCHRSLF